MLHGPRGAQFCISQRAEHIWEGVSSRPRGRGPIINTRDEPHADAERFRRLHVIVGDSNMSEWTTFMKVGITDLVLRMVEANTVMRDLSLENPIRAIREISHDMTCTRTVRLANGRELTAIEMQTEYYEKTARFLERRGGDERLEDAARGVASCALEALERGRPGALGAQGGLGDEAHADRAVPAKHDLPLASPARRAAGSGVSRREPQPRPLLRVGAGGHGRARLRRTREIKRAMREPPQTTRAKLRGDFIRQAKAKRRDYTVDWVHLKLNDQAQRTVLCKDPFRSVDERVEQLIAHM